MLMLMVILAALPSSPLRANSTQAGQILARLKIGGTGEYQVCWEISKPAGAWTASLRHLERRDQKTVRNTYSLAGTGAKLVKGCAPFHLTAGEVVLLRSDGAFTGTITGTLSLQGDAAP